MFGGKETKYVGKEKYQQHMRSTEEQENSIMNGLRQEQCNRTTTVTAGC
jgi:hypothetical protein